MLILAQLDLNRLFSRVVSKLHSFAIFKFLKFSVAFSVALKMNSFTDDLDLIASAENQEDIE